MANQYNNKVIYNGNTLIDLSNDTVTSSNHIVNGYIGHLANGTRVTGTASSNGCIRTIVASQQTLSPTNNGTYYSAVITITEGFEEGSDYIITYKNTEYYCTGILMWGSETLLGDVNYFYGSTDQPYPFGIIYENWSGGTTATIATDSSDSITLKIEKITITDTVDLVTKNITANGTYSASDDSADGYSSVTVDVPVGSTINNQNKTVTPTELSQSITYDNGYTGLGTVTVNAIPSQYKDTSSANITASDVISGKIGFNSSGSVTGTLITQIYYTGSSNPSSSLGSNGDIYLKVVS